MTRAQQVLRLLPLWVDREVRAHYRQSAFDVGWSLLTPIITVAGFGLVLSNVFGVEGEGAPYLTFAWAGVVVWTFFATGLVRATSSLVWSADLVRKLAFPREVVPLAAVLATGVDLAVGFVVLAGLMVVQDVGTSITAVAVVPVLAAVVIWACALGVLLGTANAFVRDVAHGLAVCLRVGIFVTPVMYPASDVPERYRWLVDLNPIAVYLEAMRGALFTDSWPPWELVGAHTAVGCILMVVALTYIRRVGGRLADVV